MPALIGGSIPFVHIHFVEAVSYLGGYEPQCKQHRMLIPTILVTSSYSENRDGGAQAENIVINATCLCFILNNGTYFRLYLYLWYI